MIRATRPVVAGLLMLAALAACKRENKGYAGGALDTAHPSMTTDTNKPMMPSTSSAANKWANPAVFGFATVANNGEIQLGTLAAKKGTRADVKAFGHQMVRDHKEMLAETKKLATKLGVTADTAASDARALADDAHNELQDLNTKPAGADWDKSYMDDMVSGHEKVLNELQSAAQNTNDAEVKKALESAITKVQEHLTKARDIRGKM